MNAFMGYLSPFWLWLLPLALLPWRRSLFRPHGYSWNLLLPADPASRWLDLGIRLAGSLALAGLILGLAGPYRREHVVERVGRGAHTVLLLDRSRSMDDSFAGRAPSGADEAKSAAAARLLEKFVGERPHDRIGVAAFSTSPLFVLPLTENHEAVTEAVRAARLPGLAQTHVAKGLALALSHFADGEAQAARLVLLVSDGAAVIDRANEALLRRWFAEKGVRLYWIFLRTAGSPGIFETPPPSEDSPEARPEHYLHRFFESLGIPYRAYEATSPDAVAQAVAEVDRLENQPLRYAERRPRLELRGVCFLLAALGLGVLAAAKRMEVKPWVAK